MSATRAGAQCPDGTPPPCRGAVVAPSVRRPTVALNPRSWIVVPFGNVMKAQDLDWLRDASVNLLTLDMSRWNDVNVVPDKRVSDLVRELPSGKGSEPLTLNDGIAVARRAGAGMLVMGDFLKQGKGTRIIANVFDVRTGNKVRTVSQQASEPDSLLGAFGPLARGVLAVPPPPDAKLGDAGTRSLDAYQEYLLGVKASHRFDLAEARKHLTRALVLDSTFALAHTELSFLLAWGDPSGGVGGEAKAHALAAQRLGMNLPKRERMMIDSRVASAGNDHTRSCEVARQLVALDSTDVQSLYLLGECSYHDATLDVLPSDSTIGTFHSSWNVAIRSFTKILELDPSFVVAFEHVLDILQSSQRTGKRCPTVTSAPEECTLWYAIILRRGDSLVTIPVQIDVNKLFSAQLDSARKERTRLANLARARVIAQQWFDADTTSESARQALGRVLLVSGDLTGADAYIRRLPMRATQDNYLNLRSRIEVAIKLGRGTEARAIFDSLVKSIPDIPSIAATRGNLEIAFGRLGRFDRGYSAAGARVGPEAVAYQKQVGLALLGQARETMPRDEAAFLVALTRDASCNATCRFRRIEPTYLYALHKPSSGWPTDSTGNPAQGTYSIVNDFVSGDSARIVRGALSYEKESRASTSIGLHDFGSSLIAADAYLAARDSVSAMRMARFFVDTTMRFMSLGTFISGIIPAGGAAFYPRMMLMRADLAAGLGHRDEARTWYTRVLDLWADADPELAPVVTRIRGSLAALGSPSG